MVTPPSTASVAQVAVLAALAVACGSAPSSNEPGGGNDDDTVFLAFAKDFRGYHSWEAFDVTEDADLIGIHDGSTVMEYINRLPPSGLSEFPIRTIIVKEATGGTIPHEIFAMVKRGGGFNRNLSGWEWFELENLNDAEDSVKIIWHGFGPPKGEMYGGDDQSGCNTCHNECGNDGVCAKPLALTSF